MINARKNVRVIEKILDGIGLIFHFSSKGSGHHLVICSIYYSIKPINTNCIQWFQEYTKQTNSCIDKESQWNKLNPDINKFSPINGVSCNILLTINNRCSCEFLLFWFPKKNCITSPATTANVVNVNTNVAAQRNFFLPYFFCWFDWFGFCCCCCWFCCCADDDLCELLILISVFDIESGITVGLYECSVTSGRSPKVGCRIRKKKES